jgi:hypothetical protein
MLLAFSASLTPTHNLFDHLLQCLAGGQALNGLNATHPRSVSSSQTVSSAAKRRRGSPCFHQRSLEQRTKYRSQGDIERIRKVTQQSRRRQQAAAHLMVRKTHCQAVMGG